MGLLSYLLSLCQIGQKYWQLESVCSYSVIQRLAQLVGAWNTMGLGLILMWAIHLKVLMTPVGPFPTPRVFCDSELLSQLKKPKRFWIFP